MGEERTEIPQAKFSGRSKALDMGMLDLAVQDWLMVEAKKRLQESMAKLGLDQVKVQGKHLGEMSFDELNFEKKRLKNELKIYD